LLFYLDLKSAFDERSIFPKYILDYEAKQRQVFETTNQGGGTNQPNMRQTTDAFLKMKLQGSSSTLLSDPKAQ
jgi:hypothetical protein